LQDPWSQPDIHQISCTDDSSYSQSCLHKYLALGTLLFFSGHRQKRFWNDKKIKSFSQNVWKYRLNTLLGWVLIQLWDKRPKCFSDLNVSAKNDRNVLAQKKQQAKRTLETPHSLQEPVIVHKQHTWNFMMSLYWASLGSGVYKNLR